jgi:spore coat protein CotH
MKRRVCIMSAAGLIAACAGLGYIVLSAGANTALAGTGDSHRFECNNKLLKGTYGIQMQGTRPVPGGTELETVIGVVIRTYDGSGNFTQVDNIKGAESGIVPDRPGAGTYEVNEDCSGSTRFEPAPGVVLEERFVVVDHGHEIRSITSTPPPNMITAVAKRIALR